MTAKGKKHHSFEQPSRWRWLPILALCLLLHVSFVALTHKRQWWPVTPSPATHVMQVVAIAPPAPPKPVPRPIAPQPKPPARPKPAVQPSPHVQEKIVAPAIDLPNIATPAPTSPSTDVGIALPSPPTPVERSPDPVQIKHDVQLPAAISLDYRIEAVSKGLTYKGSGNITFRVDADTGRYSIDGQAGALFLKAFAFHSEGEVGAQGVAPILYSEKRFHRAATNTHFQRERDTITFSASTNSYRREGGEQDRSSLVWQLAGIGRASPDAFAPGKVIEFFVAGTSDAQVWQMKVIGQETLSIGQQTIRAWHVVRTPRTGQYEQIIDIWLAPDQEWTPVQLRYTEPDGDYLQMTMKNSTPVTDGKVSPDPYTEDSQ